MPNNGLAKVVQHLRDLAFRQEAAKLSDGQLLQCYLAQRDEAAFAVLVRRHASLVWNICRHILPSHHDAEDAFQATFLVLVRKAGSIASPDMLANWLYGVAHRTALKASAAAGNRQAREREVAEMPQPQAEDNLWSNLLPVLDHELSRLPDKYRAAIVLCDLEGKTRKEAARLLRLPEGTVASRLTRGRTMLAKRLGRHGLAVSGGTLAAAVSQNAASACVPASVVWSTIKAATLLAAGQAAAAGVISAKVAGLTEGVVKAMFLSKLKVTVAVVMVATMVPLGGGVVWYGAAAGQGGGKGDATSQQPNKVADAPRQDKKIAVSVPQVQQKQEQKAAQPPAAKAPAAEKQESARSELLNVLKLPIEMQHFQDASPLILRDALGLLIDKVRKDTKGFELPILIDAEKFKAENEDAPNIYDTQIAFPPFPRQMTVASALRFMLDKVPTKNATYVVLPNHVLVTTYFSSSAERKLTDRVRGDFARRPLSAVLQQLADEMGVTIVVDGRAGDRAQTEISAVFGNDTDFAGALRVLAELADLKVLLLDGTFYFTTQDHAEVLRNEMRAKLKAQRELGLDVDPLWPYRGENARTKVPDPIGEFVVPRLEQPSIERKLQEKVRSSFYKGSLSSVLDELSTRYGVTIIIDNRVTDKAKTQVSVNFRDDVSLWGALRILTEMADLRAVMVDGAVFVTTAEHAEALRK
jgi:RNA polymerase sigma factor (sigma-70 family)